MKREFFLIFILMFSFTLQAGELEIEYVAGTVECKTGNGWQDLFIGDTIEEKSTIRMEQDALLEFTYQGSKIVFHREGTYPVKQILASSTELGEWGLGGLLGAKIDNIIQGKSSEGQSASMGVRAAEVTDDPFEDLWLDDEFEEEEDLLDPGKELILEGDFEEGINYFNGVKSQITALQRDEFYYYLGLAYLGAGEKAQALDSLAGSQPDNYADYYADYILVRGKLLVESQAYREALDLFNAYLAGYSFGVEQQPVYFLAGFCQAQLGQEQAALQRLEKARNLDPTNEIGNAAGLWIKKIKGN